ncbi:hypothetical protein [Legionella gresilensis]|uniref:hypothetical protein n=1 Tax=Legionella gresilensis TaxID=91823 RepID=UPI0010415484|nr:hypothetical protein [Legionella gresilensis]
MTTKSNLADDKDSSSDNESSIYAIAGRLDVQSRLLARQLHEAGHIYLLYGLLDGLNLSYSTLKYFFDVILTNSKTSSSDALHEWTLTPTGILVAATESITLIVFSMLANHFKDSDKNLFKRYIAVTWPYLRDSLKGLKNGYKGVRSAIQVANLLGGTNLNLLILPIGLAISGLTILNRIWLRHMIGLRKDMMRTNAILLASIENNENLSSEDYERIRNSIFKQTQEVKNRHRFAYIVTAYCGTADSLYYYIGVLTLCSFNWPLLLAMASLCITYSLVCIATRIYEEYDNQRKLKISQIKIDLALFIKENTPILQANFGRLQEISELIALGDKTQALLEEQDKLTINIKATLLKLKNKREHLKSLSTLSPIQACLEGMRHGLAAYGALSSVLFAIATIIVFSTATFPPALIISCISVGIIFLAGFVAYSMYQHYKHRKKEVSIVDKPYEQLNDMLKELKQIQQRNISLIRDSEHAQKTRDFKEEVKKVIDDGKKVPTAPEFVFQQWFETIRSFFSGLSKGNKAVDYTLNPLQELASDGHYHDTPVMIGISFAASALYAFTMALRAHARSFGRPPISQPKSSITKQTASVETNPKVDSVPSKDDKPYHTPPIIRQINAEDTLPSEQLLQPPSGSQDSIVAGRAPDNSQNIQHTTQTPTQPVQIPRSTSFFHTNRSSKAQTEKIKITTNSSFSGKHSVAREEVETLKQANMTSPKSDMRIAKKQNFSQSFRLGLSGFSLFSRKENFIPPTIGAITPG